MLLENLVQLRVFKLERQLEERVVGDHDKRVSQTVIMRYIYTINNIQH
jgi:hypothetical protein